MPISDLPSPVIEVSRKINGLRVVEQVSQSSGICRLDLKLVRFVHVINSQEARSGITGEQKLERLKLKLEEYTPLDWCAAESLWDYRNKFGLEWLRQKTGFASMDFPGTVVLDRFGHRAIRRFRWSVSAGIWLDQWVLLSGQHYVENGSAVIIANPHTFPHAA